MTTRVTEDALTKSEEKETARSLAMQPLKTFKTFTSFSRAFRNLSSRTFLSNPLFNVDLLWTHGQIFIMGHVTKDPVHLDASRGYRFPLPSFDTPSVSRWFTERKIFSVLIKMLWCLRKWRHVDVFRRVIKFRGGELWKIRRNNFNRGKKYVYTLPWKNETLEGGVFVSIIYGFFFPPLWTQLRPSGCTLSH